MDRSNRGHLTLKLAHPLDPGVLGERGTHEIGNIELIEIDVEIVAARSLDLPPIDQGGMLGFVITRVNGDKRTSAVLEIRDLRSVSRTGIQRAHCSLMIPIDPALRRQKILTAMRTSLDWGKQQGVVGVHLIEAAQQAEVALIRRFDEIYVENALGLFEITATYSIIEDKQTTELMRSVPVRVRVVHKGEFFGS